MTVTQKPLIFVSVANTHSETTHGYATFVVYFLNNGVDYKTKSRNLQDFEKKKATFTGGRWVSSFLSCGKDKEVRASWGREQKK